ncbi:hypothetical protein HY637_01830 [Candidatus Woesearchaeota archaeon]|nr:hypothetical protein [Candidatus Woesearchaeota archaeon]
MDEHTRQINIGGVSTSEAEIKDLIKAWVAISAAFALLLSNSVLSLDFYFKFGLSALTVGTGFLLHELGHKLVAQKYGCFAEFRSFDGMLVFAVIMALFTPFVFAAPGAVMIAGKVTKRKNGIISAAGPMVNLALALVFLGLLLLGLPKLFKSIAEYGFMINSWLALFNMLPFWQFDGYKIWSWNKPVYAVISGAAFIFVFGQSFIR